MNTYAFILAGGRGERFWPLSTFHRPKQFVTLFGGKPLIAHAVERLSGVVPETQIYVITSADLVSTTQSVLPTVPAENIIGEPMGRDTAAAVALACGIVAKRDPEGVVAILTADHLMADVPVFKKVLMDAYTVAMQHEAIVTIGIAPTYPATGYGYIECGELLSSAIATPFRKVRRFVEKPDLTTAQAYLETGAFVWNAGMFIWRAHVMAEVFRQHAPQWVPLIEAPEKMEALYPSLPKLSIDYAIMEKCRNLLVARGDFGWDDVGSLTALAEHFQKDSAGNVAIAPTVALEATHCIVASEGTTRITALIDTQDLMVVHTATATLVCPKASAQKIKQLVALLPEELK